MSLSEATLARAGAHSSFAGCYGECSHAHWASSGTRQLKTLALRRKKFFHSHDMNVLSTYTQWWQIHHLLLKIMSLLLVQRDGAIVIIIAWKFSLRSFFCFQRPCEFDHWTIIRRWCSDTLSLTHGKTEKVISAIII